MVILQKKEFMNKKSLVQRYIKTNRNLVTKKLRNKVKCDIVCDLTKSKSVEIIKVILCEIYQQLLSKSL